MKTGRKYALSMKTYPKTHGPKLFFGSESRVCKVPFTLLRKKVRIGKYGNEDCLGGGGNKRHPELKNVVIDPEIPVSYPKGVAVWKDYLLITDMYAHRILRCKLEYRERKEIRLN